jgi:hygromycin-B 7''-O-kinase
MLLPRIRTYDEFLASPRDEGTYRPAIEEICRRHGLPTDRLSKYAGGSTIVFAVGERHVVKLFEPLFHDAAETERTVLAHVHGRLGVPTPGVVAAGELEGWRYVVMDQLDGTILKEVWDEVEQGDRIAVCECLGAAISRLHALPSADLDLPGPEWPDFLRSQRETCVERQRERGLPEAWLRQIPGFLESVDLPAGPTVLLHTEVMLEHVLVRRGGAGWEVTGLFDFEPAMRGAPEYELGSIGIFVAMGDPALLRAFLTGYGYPGGPFTPQVQRRVLAYTLLHRYSNLRWYLDVVPPRSATTLDELAAEWFGSGAAPGAPAPAS